MTEKNLGLLETMKHAQRVDGWFSDQDISLLYGVAVAAVNMFPKESIVEIGSYKGRSTIVLGGAAKGSGVSVFAIDPHEGQIPGKPVPPTWDIFLENVRGPGLLSPDGPVVPIRSRSGVHADLGPLSLLFIDGAHDRVSVLHDWINYAPTVAPGRFVAFHDYWNPDFPGVKAVVEGLIADGVLEPFMSCATPGRENSLFVTKRKA
jgi:hypothetical protein